MFKILRYLADNFLLVVTILLLVFFKYLSIYTNLEKHTYIGNVIALFNAVDTLIYVALFIYIGLKHVYFKFSVLMSTILYIVYPLRYQIRSLENEVKNIESTYRFTTYPFRTISRRELYKLVVKIEIGSYYDLCTFYDKSTGINDFEDLFVDWFAALNQFNMSSYETLTGRLKLPSPIIDKIYEFKNDYYYFLYKFIQLRPSYNSYYLNVCLLYLHHTLFKQYIYKLAKIINEINSQLEGLPFTIYDNGIYRTYRLNSNEVIEEG